MRVSDLTQGYTTEEQVIGAEAVTRVLYEYFGGDDEIKIAVMAATMGAIGYSSALPLSTIEALVRFAYNTASEQAK